MRTLLSIAVLMTRLLGAWQEDTVDSALQDHDVSRCGHHTRKLLQTSYQGYLKRKYLRSPGYDAGSYQDNTFCTWELVGRPNKFLRIAFTNIDLEQSGGCEEDYVEIYKYDKAATYGEWMGRFCGNGCRPEIVIPTHRAVVVFSTNPASTRRGFELEFAWISRDNLGSTDCNCAETSGCVTCGGNMHVPTGHIYSYNHPGQYANNMDCIWKVHTAYGEHLVFEFVLLDLEPSDNCIYDYISIYNAVTGDAVVTACGARCLPRVQVAGVAATLRFHSDAARAGTGFHIRYQVHMFSPKPGQYVDCGCMASDGCMGPDALYFTTVAQYTSTPLPTSQVHMDGDSLILCGDLQLTGPNGVIESLYFPAHYPNNVECRWKISGQEGQRFKLVFEQFFIEHSADCYKDYLSIFAGEFYDCSLFCYTTCNRFRDFDWVSPSHELSIIFRTDSYNTDTGFRITYELFPPDRTPPPITTTIPSTTQTTTIPVDEACGPRDLYAPSGVVESPNYPHGYPPNVDCTWTIQGETGSQPITLHFEYVDIYSGGNQEQDCPGDRLTIYAGRPGDCSVFCYEICYHFFDFPWISPTEIVSLVFHSDAENNAAGFRIRYTVPVTATTTTTTPPPTRPPVCTDAALAGPSGHVVSPGYPGLYPEDAECKWQIHALTGDIITLNIRHMDIESSPHCSKDRLEVFDGLDNDCSLSCPVFCGIINDETWTSTRSTVTLVFRADGTNSRTGFWLEYVTQPGSNTPGFCGLSPVPIRIGYIYGGEEATPHSWPWQAVVYGSDSSGGVFCGGSLLSENWLLTAAHCVIQDDYPYAVRLGAHDRFVDEPYAYNVDVAQVVRHPDYDIPSFRNDLALLRLQTPTTFNKAIMPVCLSRSDPPPGMYCTITGWGYTEELEYPKELREATIPIFTQEECAQMNYPTDDIWLCGGGRGVSGVCFGDSGGPLVCEMEGAYTVVGMTSWGWVPCAQFAGVFTRVNRFTDWMQQVTQGEVSIRD